MLVVSNQSDGAADRDVRDRRARRHPRRQPGLEPEIAPGATGRLTITTREGTYSVHTQDDAIRAVEVKIGPPRPSGQDKLLLP